MKPLATQICIPVLSVLVLFGGCRGWESTEPPVHLNQNMDTQPKLKPYRNSEFFADGRAMRTPPEGTIARGKLKEDDHLYRGKVSGELADTFPATLPMSAELLERGQERYNIYCTPCHGKAGDGKGLVSKRLPVQAPTFHSSYLYGQKLGHFFDVISNGVRSMPGYAQQIPEADRWAIISYVRALQVGQNPKALEGGGQEELAATADISEEAKLGKALYASKTCNACHSLDGSKLVGPSFKGLYGRKEKMADGKEITANDAYIKNSILKPNDQIVEGYAPAMPSFAEGPLKLSDEDISNIIEFIKTLK